jgi:hypothetical protein
MALVLSSQRLCIATHGFRCFSFQFLPLPTCPASFNFIFGTKSGGDHRGRRWQLAVRLELAGTTAAALAAFLALAGGFLPFHDNCVNHFATRAVQRYKP